MPRRQENNTSLPLKKEGHRKEDRWLNARRKKGFAVVGWVVVKGGNVEALQKVKKDPSGQQKLRNILRRKVRVKREGCFLEGI